MSYFVNGRPIVAETDKIVEIIQVDRHVSIHSIGQERGKDHKIVWNHLQKIGFQKKLDVSVPHELTEKKSLGPNQFDPFLKRMVTGDEKWITYENLKRKKLWSKRAEPAQTIAKPGLMARNVLLCV